jgi:hypothetical protein
VIVMSDGVYAGPFAFDRSGTAENPIVLRGQSAEGAIIDGQNCDCSALVSYGSPTTASRGRPISATPTSATTSSKAACFGPGSTTPTPTSTGTTAA